MCPPTANSGLQDVGYTVDLNAAEPYTLPDLPALAAAGLLVAAAAHEHEGMVLPNIPVVLPPESLVS